MRPLYIIILFLFQLNALAQIGGNGVFTALKLVPNARTNGWGGYCNAFRKGEGSLFLNNPALLGDQAHNQASLNFNTQFPGVWSGNGSYSMKYRSLGYFGASVSFINYGNMDAYDAAGNPEGTVSSSETVFALGFAKPLNSRITYGVSAKVAYSILAGYVGNGMGFDFGAVYTTKDSILSAGLVFKNAGFMVGHYRDAQREKYPFQAEMGVNFKPAHMPFRFNIVYHDLQRFDLTYNQYLKDDQNIDLSGKTVVSEQATFGDRLLRHFVVGTELVLGKNFGILAAYNHQRRKEMAPSEAPGVTGYSWGIHLKVSKFNITYSSAAYFPGFNTNMFTFSAKLSDFKQKSPSSQDRGGN